MAFLLFVLASLPTLAYSQATCTSANLACMSTTDCAQFGTTSTCDGITGGFGCCSVTTTTAATTTAASVTSVISSTSTNSSCVDRLNPLTGVSDCPSRASLCTDSVYLTGEYLLKFHRLHNNRKPPTIRQDDMVSVMQQQCPKTCGFCSANGTSSTSTNGTCVDLLNPLTGVSDCPSRSSLCTNSVYLEGWYAACFPSILPLSVMQQQCPLTCGFCTSSNSTSSLTGTNSTSTNSTTCIDLTNAATGISDCPDRKLLCNNTIYLPLMQIQCPATCGFCT